MFACSLRTALVACLTLIIVVSTGWDGSQKARGQGAVAFQPQIGTVPDGAQFSVVPVVSHDRRYVRLGLSPLFSTLNGFDIFTTSAAVGGTGFGGGGIGLVGSSFALPNVSQFGIGTTVIAPTSVSPYLSMSTGPMPRPAAGRWGRVGVGPMANFNALNGQPAQAVAMPGAPRLRPGLGPGFNNVGVHRFEANPNLAQPAVVPVRRVRSISVAPTGLDGLQNAINGLGRR